METSLEEEEIKKALLGDEQAQYVAVTKAYERYSRPLLSYLREKVGPTLDSHELATAVNDVFIELARKAKKGRLKENGSLVALLFKMAKANAIDQWRSKRRREKRHVPIDQSRTDHDGSFDEGLANEQLISKVAACLAEAPEIATAWRRLTERRTAADEVAANEIVREFKMWLGNLSRLQRKVAESMALHFGDVTDKEIADEIARTDERPPISSIKSARMQIREKFTSLMNHYERSTQ